jgi:hypothetical protein
VRSANNFDYGATGITPDWKMIDLVDGDHIKDVSRSSNDPFGLVHFSSGDAKYSKSIVEFAAD